MYKTKWLSTHEVATKLGLTSTTICRWIRDGKIPATQYTKRGPYKIDEQDLEIFLKQCRINS